MLVRVPGNVKEATPDSRATSSWKAERSDPLLLGVITFRQRQFHCGQSPPLVHATAYDGPDADVIDGAEHAEVEYALTKPARARQPAARAAHRHRRGCSRIMDACGLIVTVGVVDSTGPRVKAVVFDLLFTLVHPRGYPGDVGRVGWLADILGVDAAVLNARWTAFEPILETGQAVGGANGLGPELAWVDAVAADLGVAVTADDMARIDAGWDLTRRAALLDPPYSSVAALTALRGRDLRLGVLSNTHARELRAWDQSPLAPLVDVVALSHEIGVCKPDPAAYA
jgi:FMN phosphatase YigB (HAD superfamily)